jgi:hypothetical protein
MSEVTNSTPLVTPTQHKALTDAAEVLEHLATEADNDTKVGRAPEGVGDDLRLLAYKVNGTAMLLELAGMVSDG